MILASLPLVIETFQGGEWRRLYEDDEWRGNCENQ